MVAFAAEVPAAAGPVLDSAEHDSFAWYSFEEAEAALDWPVEHDALAGRRKVLSVLADMLGDKPNTNA